MEKTIITQLSRSESLRLRVTKEEHNHLKKLARKEGKPVATVAYALLIKSLNMYSQ